MKKILTILLVTGICLTGCSSNAEKETTEQSTVVTEAVTVETTILETTAETTIEMTTAAESSALELAAGVGDNPLYGLSVEETVNMYMTAKKELDEEILAYFNEDASVPTQNIGIEAEKAVESLAYEITDISESDDIATVKMSVTNKNMGIAAQKYMQLVGEKIAEAGQNASEGTTGEIMEEVALIIADEIDSEELITIEVEIELTKVDGMWFFSQEENNLEDAMFGGIISGMAEALMSAMAAR